MTVTTDDATRVSTCSACAWTGWTGNGECPACRTAPETDRLYHELAREPRNVEVRPRVLQRRAASAPGRNDPCTCQSGRKAKKCCFR
jgi:hypothetical protein